MSLIPRLLATSMLTAALVTTSCVKGPEGVVVDASPGTPDYEPPDINYSLISADVDPPVVAWSDSVDFGKLRNLYGRRRDFGSRCEHPPEKRQAFEAVQAGNASQTLELTESLLARCPVDPLLHHWRSSALASMGLEAEAEVHQKWIEGLMDSILATGDGRTMQTPFVTISIYEEYELLSYLGLTRKQQSLVQGPVALDAIVAERGDGTEVTVYFNPALHFVRLYEDFE